MSGQGDEPAVFFQVNSQGCSLGRKMGEPQNRPKYSGEEKTVCPHQEPNFNSLIVHYPIQSQYVPAEMLKLRENWVV
jgi:hypothetical protein